MTDAQATPLRELVEAHREASHAVRTLVGLGVGVSIDDFGTGRASLAYLRTSPCTH